MLRSKQPGDIVKKAPCKRSYQRYFPQNTEVKSLPKFNVKEPEEEEVENVLEELESEYVENQEFVESNSAASIKFEVEETVPILKSAPPTRLPSLPEVIIEDLDSVEPKKSVERKGFEQTDKDTFLTTVRLDDLPPPINSARLRHDPKIQQIILEHPPPLSPVRQMEPEKIPHVLEVLKGHMSEKDRKMVSSEVSTSSTLAAHKPARKQTVSATRPRASTVDTFNKTDVTKYSEQTKKSLELELWDVVERPKVSITLPSPSSPSPHNNLKLSSLTTRSTAHTALSTRRATSVRTEEPRANTARKLKSALRTNSDALSASSTPKSRPVTAFGESSPAKTLNTSLVQYGFNPDSTPNRFAYGLVHLHDHIVNVQKAEQASEIVGKGENYAQMMQQKDMKEHNFLANSAKRAGNTQEQAASYFKMAMTCDISKQYAKAIRLYKKFLDASLSSGDTLGEALAYNHLGLDYFYLGSEEDKKTAMEYHRKHVEISSDPASQCIANLNLGIVYYSEGDMTNANTCLRQAYGCAIFLEDLEAQSLSCDYLSLVSIALKEFSVAKMYLEKRAKIMEPLKDDKTSAIIYMQLGQLHLTWKGPNSEAAEYLNKAIDLSLAHNNTQVLQMCYEYLGQIYTTTEQYELAIENLKKAMDIADESGDQQKMRVLKCSLGAAEGSLRMKNLFPPVVVK